MLGRSPYVVQAEPGQAALWTGRRPPLGRLDIELCERCNNNCIHCCINRPQHDTAAQQAELSTAQIMAALDQAASLGCMQVRFTGGEPLLRDDFQDLYLYARRLGLKVLLFTNARLITPELAELLARVPPLVPIEVTVYGMRRASYEAVSRVPGSYAEFRRGIDLLLERGVPVVIKGTWLPPNRSEIDELDAWATCLPSMGYAPSHATVLDLRSRRDSEAKNQLIRMLRLSPQQYLQVTARAPERYVDGMRQFFSRFAGPPGDQLFLCGAGNGGCLDAYGRLQPCLMLRAPKLSVELDLSSDREQDLDPQRTLRHALTEISARLSNMRAKNPEYLARCARCFLKDLCEQCPAWSWAEHGTLDTPVEYLCQVSHEQAYYLGLLTRDECAWEVENWKERVDHFVGGQ